MTDDPEAAPAALASGGEIATGPPARSTARMSAKQRAKLSRFLG